MFALSAAREVAAELPATDGAAAERLCSVREQTSRTAAGKSSAHPGSRVRHPRAGEAPHAPEAWNQRA